MTSKMKLKTADGCAVMTLSAVMQAIDFIGLTADDGDTAQKPYTVP